MAPRPHAPREPLMIMTKRKKEEAYDATRRTLLKAQRHGCGQDNDPSAAVFRCKCALPVAVVTWRDIEPDMGEVESQNDASQSQGDHRHPENGQLSADRKSQGEPEAEETGHCEGT